MALKERLRARSVFLFFVFFTTSFLLLMWSWVNVATSYGFLHLSINDPITGLVGDVFLKNGALFVGFPSLEYHHIISRGMLKYLFVMFRFPVLFVLGNVALLCFIFFVLLVIAFLRFVRDRCRSFRKLSSKREVVYSLLPLWKFFIFSLLLMSLFPINQFTGWASYLDYIPPPKLNSSIGPMLYDLFGAAFSTGYRTKLAFAWSFSFFEYLLTVSALVSLSLIFFSRFKMPTWVEKLYPRFVKLEEELSKIPKNRRLQLSLAFSLFMSILLYIFFYGSLPNGWNQIANVFQAKIFSAFCLKAPLPKTPELLTTPYLAMNKHWFSSVFPWGYSLFILPFEFINFPYLLNIIVSCLTVIFFFKLLDKLNIGSWALAFLVLSPGFLLMSSQFQSQSLVNLFFVLFLLEYISWKDKKDSDESFTNLVRAALYSGIAFNILPLSSTALFFPFVLVFCYKSIKAKKYKNLAIFFSILLGFLFLYLGISLLQTGKLVVPFFDTFSWHDNKFCYFPRNMGIKGIVHLIRSLNEINFSFFGWPLPVFFFVFISQLGLRRDGEFFYLLLASIVIMLFAHYFLFDPAIGFHPPVIRSASCAIVLLVSVGISNVRPLFFGEADQPMPSSLPFVFCMLLSVGVLFFNLLPKIVENKGEANKVISRLLESSKIKDAIVFVDPYMINYKQAFYLNDPLLENSVLFFRAKTREAEALVLEHFSKRKGYVFTYSDEGFPVFVPYGEEE